MATAVKTQKAKAMPPIITGHGKNRQGEIVFTVSSRSHPGKLHVVTERVGAYTCTCEAGQHRKRCAHVEAVEARLFKAQERRVGAISQPRNHDDRVPLWASKGNEPFSMWKR